MRRIDEPVALACNQRRRYDQYALAACPNEFIPQSGKFGGGRSLPPICRQLTDFNSLPRQIIWNIGRRQHQVGRRIASFKMYKIFEHRQRLMFGGIAESGAGTGPAPSILIGTFAVE